MLHCVYAANIGNRQEPARNNTGTSPFRQPGGEKGWSMRDGVPESHAKSVSLKAIVNAAKGTGLIAGIAGRRSIIPVR